MKVILVDDEPAMHLILHKMLDKLPAVQVAGAFTDTKSAFAFLSGNPDIRLAFVDISMKDENGMDFAAEVERSGAPVQIVFVTSHKDFALEAFELSALDYLVKPVSQERLQRTVNRALAGRREFSEPSARAEASPAVVITALGDVAVSGGAGRVKWMSRKCTELFAYLLLHHGRRIPRSRLVADIFGGMDSANAENYLNTIAYQLRKSLEPLGMREAVRSENDGYALELKHAVIDCERFERLANELQTIDPGNTERALQAERLYTGDLFGDKAYVWAVPETERLAEMYGALVKRLAAALIAQGNMSTAAKLLIKLNERNPLDEAVIGQLMAIRELAGDRVGLAALYADYVRLLDRELGIRPSAELRERYEEMLGRMSRVPDNPGD